MKFDLSIDYDLKKLEKRLEFLKGKQARIELNEFKPRRTSSQNRYFHSVCGLLGNELGYTIEEMKVVIKDELDFMQYEKGGKKFRKSTADLDTVEFAKLIDYVIKLGDDHGVRIPTPDEYRAHQWEVEKEFDNIYENIK